MLLDELPKLHPLPSPQDLTSDPGFLTTVLCALGGFSLLLGLASREQRLQRWTRPLSGLVWAALLALGQGFLFTGGLVSAWDQVRWVAGGAGGRGTPRPPTCTQDTSSKQLSSVSLQLPAPAPPPPGVLFPLCHLHYLRHVAFGHERSHRCGSCLVALTPAGPRAVSWASAGLKTRAAAAGEHIGVAQAAPRASSAGRYLVRQGIHQPFAEL